MKNLKQLHYCKERGALSSFSTDTCQTCPYFEKAECTGLDCMKKGHYNVKSNKNIWASVFFIFIALSLYFAATSPEIQNSFITGLGLTGIDRNMMRLLRSSGIIMILKGSFTILLGMLSIKSFILLLQPEKVRL